MNTDIKSLIPSMHAELKRMQSRVAELQVSLQQGSSDEKAIREEFSRMNLRQVEIMDAIERMFRHLAIGRRNWMHTGSHLGAENIAFMFSLFESCKLNDINFGDYIEDILTRLMEGEQDFMSLTPCNYNSNKKVNVKAA
ncbi:MAG: hypothetical protein UEL26_09525 [Segatella copri]|nr:hypothetical protein [Segatella copri]